MVFPTEKPRRGAKPGVESPLPPNPPAPLEGGKGDAQSGSGSKAQPRRGDRP